MIKYIISKKSLKNALYILLCTVVLVFHMFIGFEGVCAISDCENTGKIDILPMVSLITETFIVGMIMMFVQYKNNCT